MSYSEDAQPNEMRHARKGNMVVPTIQTSQPVVGRLRRGRGFANDNTGRGGGNRGSFNPGIRARGGAFHPNSQPRALPPHLASGSRGSPQNRGQHHNRRFKKPKLVHAAIGNPGTSQISLQHQITSHRAPRGIAHEDSGKEDPWTQHWLSHHQLEAPALNTVVQDHDLSMSAMNHSPLYGDQDALLASSANFGGTAVLSDATHTRQLRNDDSELTSYTIVKQEPSPSPCPSQLPSPPLLVTILPDSPQLPQALLLDLIDEPGLIGGPAEQIVSPHASVPVSVHLAQTTERTPRFRSGKLRFRLPQRRRSPDAIDSTANLFSEAGPSNDLSISEDTPDTVLTSSADSLPGPASNIDTGSALVDALEAVQMRREPHDKPRRLFSLISDHTLSVTMRGSLDCVEQAPLRCSALRTVMGEDARQLVDDACVLPHPDGDIVALGRLGDTRQLSLLRVQDRKVLDLGCYDRPVQSDKKGGISAISASMQPGTFVTGGYDHLVHLWSLSDDYNATASPLAIKHTSMIQSLLAIRDTSDKLLSGSADCSVSVYDLTSERVVNLLKLSNSVYHVHAAISPSCMLLEIGHRELQFEIRDIRLVPAAPVMRFGYPNAKVHGRYTRGDVEEHVFACGGSEKDGCVRLWDLRNPVNPTRTVECFPGRRATLVVLNYMQMTVASEDHQLVHMQLETAIGSSVVE